MDKYLVIFRQVTDRHQPNGKFTVTERQEINTVYEKLKTRKRVQITLASRKGEFKVEHYCYFRSVNNSRNTILKTT